MKKLNALLFLLLFITQHSFTQTWPEPGAEWTYCYSSSNDFEIPMTAGSEKYYYTRDTLIGAVLYNVVERELFSTDPYTTYYTRYSNDTVYRWINETEHLYFHFDLHLGEVFTTYRSIAGSSSISCSSVLPLEVVDSTTVIISGEELTKWTLRDTLGFDPEDTGFPSYPEFELIENIGFPDYNQFYSPWEGEGCNEFVVESVNYLDGYNSDIFTEWVADCPMASVEEAPAHFFEFYPNPIHSNQAELKVNILSNQDEWEFILMDLYGKIVFTERLTTNENTIYINQMNLSKGMYFASLMNENGEIRVSEKLLIQ